MLRLRFQPGGQAPGQKYPSADSSTAGPRRRAGAGCGGGWPTTPVGRSKIQRVEGLVGPGPVLSPLAAYTAPAIFGARPLHQWLKSSTTAASWPERGLTSAVVPNIGTPLVM